MEKKSGVARVVFNETAFREFHPHGSQRLLRIYPFQGHAGRTGITGNLAGGFVKVKNLRDSSEVKVGQDALEAFLKGEF